MAEDFESYIRQLRNSTISFSNNAKKLDVSLYQLAAAIKDTPLDTDLSKINNNINEIKALISSVNSQIKELGEQMQQNLNDIKIPDEVNDAVKKRLTIDKENQVSFKEVLSRLNTLADIDKQRAEDEKTTKSASRLQDQKDRMAKDQLLYKIFGLVNPFLDTVGKFFLNHRNIFSGILKAGIALFGKEIPKWGKWLSDAFQIPKILGLLGAIGKGVGSLWKNVRSWFTAITQGLKAPKWIEELALRFGKTPELKTFLKPEQVPKELNMFQKAGQFLSKDILSFLPNGIKEGLVKAALETQLAFGKINFGGLKVDAFGKSLQELRKSLTVFNKFKTGIVNVFKGFQGSLKTLTTMTKASKIAKLGLPFLKRIPIIGSVFNLISGFQRFNQGDIYGAGLEILSGIANLFPGAGTVISIIGDLLNAGRDFGWFSWSGEKLEGLLGKDNPISNMLQNSIIFNSKSQGKQNKGVGDGSSGDPFIVSSTADMSYIQPKLQTALYKASADMFRETGKKPIITSAFRSNKKQAELWYRANVLHDKNVYMPAQPVWDEAINGYKVKGSGNKRRTGHMVGGAIDVDNWQLFRPYAQRYGLSWMGKKDPVHFQLNDAFDVPQSGSIIGWNKDYINIDNMNKYTQNEGGEFIRQDDTYQAQISQEDRPRTIGDIMADAMSELQNIQNMAQSKESQDFFRSLATGTSSQATSSPSINMSNPIVNQSAPVPEAPKIVVNADSGTSVPVIDDTSLIMQQLRYMNV